MSKKKGGLGIRSMYIMNQSLIVKLMRQWLTRDKWWKDITITDDETF
jgi:hypothetical protein